MGAMTDIRRIGSIRRSRVTRTAPPRVVVVRLLPLVLCYHAVSDRWDDALAVSPDAFERQLRFLLLRRLRPVSAGGVPANRPRTFHVTFDDAYRSVAVNAMPVLERLAVPATVFACSDYARDGRALDVPELRARTGAHPEELSTMDWDALRELATRGIEIGSHTVSHAHLPRLGDAELRAELGRSREQIESELSRPCRYLAYPFGEDDPRVWAAARDAGYEAAYTLRGDARNAALHSLPRIDVYRGDGLGRFALKVSSLYRPVTGVLEALRRR